MNMNRKSIHKVANSIKLATIVSILVSLSYFSWAADNNPKAKEAPKGQVITSSQMIKIKSDIKFANDAHAGYNHELKSACDHKVEISADPELVVADFGKINQSKLGLTYCSHGIKGLYKVCKESPEGEREGFKELIKTKIKKLHCVLAKGEEINVSYSKGTLTLGLGPYLNDQQVYGKVYEFVRTSNID